MKKTLRLVYMALVRCIKKFKWKIQTICINVPITSAEPVEKELKLNNEDRILIVVPHADDELIACHSIIKKYEKKVVLFYSGMTGDNNSEENKMIRQREFINYCEQMNAQYILCQGNLCQEIKNLISDGDIKAIFIPTVIDWHEEHRSLCLSVIDIVNKIKQKVSLFAYQVTVPISQKYITHYSQMSKKENAEKWMIFKKVYLSQGFMPVRRFKMSEKLYIKNRKRIACEVFMKMDNNKAVKLLHNANYSELDSLKSDINDLKKIRNKSELKYEDYFNLSIV